jgi:hypothetical protein
MFEPSPEAGRAWVASHLFGPPRIVEHEGDQAWATVPVRVVMLDGPKLEVEFERIPVKEPVTAEQLPTRVKVVSRFGDGVERSGAFMRNPTSTPIVEPYRWRIASLDFWDGHGYFVRTIGEGPVMRCRSGGVIIQNKKGEWVESPPPPPPSPTYPPGRAEPEPTPASLDAPIEYWLDAIVVKTTTPTFTLPMRSHTRPVHVWVQSIGDADACSADELPHTVRRVSLPTGVLQPGTSYLLGATSYGEPGSVSGRTYRIIVADCDDLESRPIEYTLDAAGGRAIREPQPRGCALAIDAGAAGERWIATPFGRPSLRFTQHSRRRSGFALNLQTHCHLPRTHADARPRAVRTSCPPMEP